MMKFTISCLVSLLLAASYVAGEKYVICYYGTWATYRPGLGKFDVSNINPDLCTHAVYTFVGLDDQGTVISLDPWLDLPDNWGRNNFGAFNALKQKNPELKTLLAVGGWNFGSAKFSVMSANATFRRNFITSAVKMLQDHGFDGLDVDWEYPNRRDTVHGEADIDNFTELLKELREEFDKHGLFLSAAVSAVGAVASLSYDIPAISRYLDLINIMTYDMYGPWDPVTGHNSPLHYGIGDDGANKDELFTLDVALQFWLNAGAPAEKIAIGVPFYGRTFTLTNANNNFVRAPSSGPGINGQYTGTSGFIGYNEFCSKLQSETWTKRYDDLAKVPYAHSGRNWVSYDDADSITEKVAYAVEYGIAGVMIWSIETDDFHDICDGGDFPLLRAVNKALGRCPAVDIPVDTTIATPETTITASEPTTSNSSDLTTSVIPTTWTPSTTILPTTTTAEVTTTTKHTIIDPDCICVEEGFAPDPTSCYSFYMCVYEKDGSLKAWKFQCPTDLAWDIYNSVCNYSHLVNCQI